MTAEENLKSKEASKDYSALGLNIQPKFSEEPIASKAQPVLKSDAATSQTKTIT